MLEWVLDVTQIIIADIVLSGDNALIIGMAAAAVPEEGRKKVKKSLNLALKGKHRRRRASAPSYGKKMSSVKARNWLLHERLKKSRKSRKSKK